MNTTVYVFIDASNLWEVQKASGDGYFDVLKTEEDIWGRELQYRTKKAVK